MTTLQFWELLSYVATALGIPAGILAYCQVKSRERQEREYEAYDAVDACASSIPGWTCTTWPSKGR